MCRHLSGEWWGQTTPSPFPHPAPLPLMRAPLRPLSAMLAQPPVPRGRTEGEELIPKLSGPRCLPGRQPRTGPSATSCAAAVRRNARHRLHPYRWGCLRRPRGTHRRRLRPSRSRRRVTPPAPHPVRCREAQILTDRALHRGCTLLRQVVGSAAPVTPAGPIDPCTTPGPDMTLSEVSVTHYRAGRKRLYHRPTPPTASSRP